MHSPLEEGVQIIKPSASLPSHSIKTLEVVILAKVLVSMYRHAHSTYFIPFPRTVDTVYVDVNRAEQAGLFIGEIHSRQYASGSTG
eukprot:2773098-Pyramimonas_sp.AAC.3